MNKKQSDEIPDKCSVAKTTPPPQTTNTTPRWQRYSKEQWTHVMQEISPAFVFVRWNLTPIYREGIYPEECRGDKAGFMASHACRVGGGEGGTLRRTSTKSYLLPLLRHVTRVRHPTRRPTGEERNKRRENEAGPCYQFKGPTVYPFSGPVEQHCMMPIHHLCVVSWSPATQPPTKSAICKLELAS